MADHSWMPEPWRTMDRTLTRQSRLLIVVAVLSVLTAVLAILR